MRLAPKDYIKNCDLKTIAGDALTNFCEMVSAQSGMMLHR